MRIWKLLLVAGLVLSGCVTDPQLDGFVREFVASVFENSEFHRTYIVDADDPMLNISRENMTADFEILGFDYFGPGQFEYRVRFSNGASGLVTISLQGDSVKNADLSVRALTMQQSTGR